MAKALLLSGLVCAALTLGEAALAAGVPEACNSYKAAVTGGPLPPPESDTVVIRWLANANFEFGYKGKVYLFDAYFDRTPRSHALGFKAADMPNTAFLAPLYRSPICVGGAGLDKGKVVSFKY